MNPIIVLLVIFGAILLWFICAFLFRPIGRFFKRLWKDAMNAMKDKEQKE